MPEFEEYQRRRWTRENAHLYVRHDAYRYMAPGAPFYVGQDVVKYGWPHAADEPQPSIHDAELLQQPDVKADLEFEAELRRLRCDVASMRLDWELAKLAWKARKYNPDQPRVPAGNPDGGQWTSEGAQGGSSRVRLAAADKPRLGPAAIASIAFEAAKRAIEAYRKDNLFIDLFQSRIGTVSYTELNGEGIFGSNSTSPTYTSHDRAAATVLRDRLVEKYPAVMNTDQLGRRPNEALFHAETTILLRASRASGGSLSGRTLEIYSDRRLCSSCESVLPYVGIELGNPSVIFIQPNGQRRTMRNGSWVD